MRSDRSPISSAELSPIAPANRERPRSLRRLLALRPTHLLVVTLGGLWFFVLGYLPLGGGSVLGHVSFGEWILEQRQIPAENPFLPLAEGMRIVDGEWLSQVVMARVHGVGGTRGLAVLFALCSLATAILWGRTFFLRSSGLLWGTAGVAMALALAMGTATTLGPHTFGTLCFAVVLRVAFGGAHPGREETPAGLPGDRGRWLWLGLPLLFALWANLDGSFVYGLAVLLACLLDHTAEVLRRERSLRRLLADRPLRRRLWLTELAALSTLLNPYGLRLLASALWLPGSGTLETLAGHQSLPMTGLPGRLFAASVILLLLTLRFGRRPVPVACALLLLFFGWRALSHRGTLAWYGPVFGLTTAPLLAELTGRAADAWRRRSDSSPPGALRLRLATLAGPSWHYSLLAFVVLWAAFALSPAGGAVLGREPRPSVQVIGGAPTAGLVERLRAEPPNGLIFNPAPWGDWLVREGPPGLQVFATSRTDHLPVQVWRDYRMVVEQGSSWRGVLDRYGVVTVVLDRMAHRSQVQSLRYDSGWLIVYEDPRSVVFERAAHPEQGSSA